MHITYKKLWKLLIDREMNKQDLKRFMPMSLILTRQILLNVIIQLK